MFSTRFQQDCNIATPKQHSILNDYITTNYRIHPNKTGKSGAKWGQMKQCGGKKKKHHTDTQKKEEKQYASPPTDFYNKSKKDYLTTNF